MVVIGFAVGAIAELLVNLALLKGAQLTGVDLRQFNKRAPGAGARARAQVTKIIRPAA